MINDDGMEVHFGLALLDRAADHAYCHNYPSKINPMKWMKLGCVVPAFALGV